MTTDLDTQDSRSGSSRPVQGRDLLLARQPIFSASGRRVAYELLHRRRPDEPNTPEASPTRMTSDVLVNALLTLGLEEVTGGLPAFVNLDAEMLEEEAVRLLDPDRTTLEVLETVEVDEGIEETCRSLREQGYRIALDDYRPGSPAERLLPAADIVKLDVLELDEAELESALDSARDHGAMPLAERVETREIHKACEELGFRLYQGFFYREPETLEARELGVTHSTVIRLMNQIRDPNVPDAEIADEFRTDPGLSYKLLRIVKTASIGARGVTSIGHAVRLLGRKPLYRWLSLLFLSSLSSGDGVDRELTETAIARARLMELLAEATGEGREADSYFLVGLFSLIEPLLEAPMEDVLERVDLEPRLRRGLLDGEGAIGDALALVRAYEEGDWQRARSLAVELDHRGDLADLYVSALEWTRKRLDEVEDPGEAEKTG